MYQLTASEKARNPQPNHIFTEYQNRVVCYEEILDPVVWLHVGHIPVPTTRAGWFLYHLIHGLWMRYPARKVLLYALANCDPKQYLLEPGFSLWE
jgi:hypothetical protein